MRINAKKYRVNCTNWYFKDASVFIQHDGHIKIYKNSCNEYIKVELNCLRFKFNEFTNFLSCSGRFSAYVKIDKKWKSI